MVRNILKVAVVAIGLTACGNEDVLLIGGDKNTGSNPTSEGQVSPQVATLIDLYAEPLRSPETSLGLTEEIVLTEEQVENFKARFRTIIIDLGLGQETALDPVFAVSGSTAVTAARQSEIPVSPKLVRIYTNIPITNGVSEERLQAVIADTLRGTEFTDDERSEIVRGILDRAPPRLANPISRATVDAFEELAFPTDPVYVAVVSGAPGRSEEFNASLMAGATELLQQRDLPETTLVRLRETLDNAPNSAQRFLNARSALVQILDIAPRPSPDAPVAQEQVEPNHPATPQVLIATAPAAAPRPAIATPISNQPATNNPVRNPVIVDVPPEQPVQPPVVVADPPADIAVNRALEPFTANLDATNSENFLCNGFESCAGVANLSFDSFGVKHAIYERQQYAFLENTTPIPFDTLSAIRVSDFFTECYLQASPDGGSSFYIPAQGAGWQQVFSANVLDAISTGDAGWTDLSSFPSGNGQLVLRVILGACSIEGIEISGQRQVLQAE